MNDALRKPWAQAMVRVALLTALLVDGIVVLLFAMNPQELWVILSVSGGILVGLVTIRGDGRVAGLLCSLGLLFVPSVVIVRALPIHSFDWWPIDQLDRIMIESPSDGAAVEITDPRMLREFEGMVGKGYYKTIIKCGDCYRITLCDHDNRSNFVLLYDSFGSLGGGFTQTVFVPRDEMVFRKWLERILNKDQGKVPKSGTSRL